MPILTDYGQTDSPEQPFRYLELCIGMISALSRPGPQPGASNMKQVKNEPTSSTPSLIEQLSISSSDDQNLTVYFRKFSLWSIVIDQISLVTLIWDPELAQIINNIVINNVITIR